jgi:hypothetical protein
LKNLAAQSHLSIRTDVMVYFPAPFPGSNPITSLA